MNHVLVPPSQLPILYVFSITRICKVPLSQSFAYIWYQETNSLGLIRLPSCNFKMEAMLWKVAHEGMKFNLWTTSHTLPLFYLRRLEFLISFKGTFEFDLNINVTFSCKLEFVCENWNFFFEIRAYLLLNIGVFGSFFIFNRNLLSKIRVLLKLSSKEAVRIFLSRWSTWRVIIKHLTIGTFILLKPFRRICPYFIYLWYEISFLNENPPNSSISFRSTQRNRRGAKPFKKLRFPPKLRFTKTNSDFQTPVCKTNFDFQKQIPIL